VETVLNGCEVEDVIDQILDVDKMLQWQGKNYDCIEIVKQYGEETQILYHKMK